MGAEYVLNLLPKGTHEYAKFIRPSEMASWIREAGLELDQMTGLLFNPLTKKYSLNERRFRKLHALCPQAKAIDTIKRRY